jgi:hypothetical protein
MRLSQNPPLRCSFWFCPFTRSSLSSSSGSTALAAPAVPLRSGSDAIVSFKRRRCGEVARLSNALVDGGAQACTRPHSVGAMAAAAVVRSRRSLEGGGDWTGVCGGICQTRWRSAYCPRPRIAVKAACRALVPARCRGVLRGYLLGEIGRAAQPWKHCACLAVRVGLARCMLHHGAQCTRYAPPCTPASW